MIDLEQTRAYPPKEDTKYKLKKYILVFIKVKDYQINIQINQN
jgi:hypothetical protein